MEPSFSWYLNWSARTEGISPSTVTPCENEGVCVLAQSCINMFTQLDYSYKWTTMMEDMRSIYEVKEHVLKMKRTVVKIYQLLIILVTTEIINRREKRTGGKMKKKATRVDARNPKPLITIKILWELGINVISDSTYSLVTLFTMLHRSHLTYIYHLIHLTLRHTIF